MSDTVHCGICKKAVKGENFHERMEKLREHRHKVHGKKK